MKPIYICDLEGTTGVYSSGANGIHINDLILLRSGFREMVQENNKGNLKMVIASRAPKSFVKQIKKILSDKGINLTCPIYTNDEVEIGNEDMLPYKDYNKVYHDLEISNPAKDSVILGDFLRFQLNSRFNAEAYRNFDFRTNPEVLTRNYALNDHPLPRQGEETPLYVVLPQPWTTTFSQGHISLDMSYVISCLKQIYSIGRNNFKEGLRLLSNSGQLNDNQHVTNNDLAKRVLGEDIPQDYLVMRGRRDDWKPLEEVM